MASKLDILTSLIGHQIVLRWSEPGVYAIDLDTRGSSDLSTIHEVNADILHTITKHGSSSSYRQTERWIDMRFVSEIIKHTLKG